MSLYFRISFPISFFFLFPHTLCRSHTFINSLSALKSFQKKKINCKEYFYFVGSPICTARTTKFNCASHSCRQNVERLPSHSLSISLHSIVRHSPIISVERIEKRQQQQHQHRLVTLMYVNTREYSEFDEPVTVHINKLRNFTPAQYTCFSP